ncbi:MAG: hypothetical protein H0W46_03530 [Acidimicrobiia bacterium]|nr:hypothetical protein [Acidimicrobiia bacterium]
MTEHRLHDDRSGDEPPALQQAAEESPATLERPPAEHRDELPDDLNAAGYAGPYRFPDNSRRRIPGVIYLGLAAVCVVVWVLGEDGAAFVNDGFLWAAAALVVVAVISITSGWRMHVDEKEALVAAQQAVGFPVGHASAQQVWRGLRSRPTWRVLCYSTEDPPTRRGLVLVDAVDGRVVEHLVEDNPERWSAAPPTPPDRV